MHTRLRIAAVTLLFWAAAISAKAQILPAGAVPTRLSPSNNIVGGAPVLFVESPLYDGNGGVYFSDDDPAHVHDRLLHYDIASGTTTVADPSSGGANGTYYNANHQIVSCDRERRQISLRNHDDITIVDQVLASRYNGAQFNGPNDLVADANGGIYFTDPDYEGRHSLPDGVYYLNPQGVVSQLLSYADGSHRPNGLILSPDGNTLYLALEQKYQILAFDVNQQDGSISRQRTFAATNLKTNGIVDTSIHNGPDGLTIDPAGNVYAAVFNAVWAWNPAGQELFRLNMPGSGSTLEDPTNVDFVAAGKGLYGVHLNIATPSTGDYNGDGVVDAADYTVWRDTVGSTTNFAADGDSAGDSKHVIDQADYDYWLGKFQVTFGSAAASSSTVPEPGALGLAIVAAILLRIVRLRPQNH
jgi:gluconolactonase